MQYLTISEAARALSVCENTIRSMLPELRAVDVKKGAKSKRLIRIPVWAIEAYLDGCEISKPVPVQRNETVLKIERRRA